MVKFELHNLTDFIIGIICLITGLVIYFVVIPLTIVTRTTGWSAHYLFSSTTFVPQIWAILIIVWSIIILLTSTIKAKPFIKNENKDLNIIIDFKIIIPIVVLFIVMVSFVVLLKQIGFIFTSIICLSATLWVFGIKNIFNIIIYSIVASLSIYVFFNNILNIAVP